MIEALIIVGVFACCAMIYICAKPFMKDPPKRKRYGRYK